MSWISGNLYYAAVVCGCLYAVPVAAQYTSNYQTNGYASANPGYAPQSYTFGVQGGTSSYHYGARPAAQVPNSSPYGTGNYAAAGYAPQTANAASGYGNTPTDTRGVPVRYEQYIPPTERPGRAAARTVAARSAGISGLTRPVNFPRDAGDDVDVLKLQIFLDYHGYSVGEIDGQWGYNTERALFVYQKNNGMPATGQLDDRMMQRLNSFTDGYLLEYTLGPEDVKGPFYQIPRTYPEQEKMKFLPYETQIEALGEKFHCSQSLLRKLNPGVDFENVRAGQTIYGLNTIEGIDDKRGNVAKIRISKSNKWIEAFDSEGRFMFYYPSTLGSEHDDLKTGAYKVADKPIYNPPFTYKPNLMWDDEVGRECHIPPGPNSPVGVVWIMTSKSSVGIHGTPNPENISKNFSHGCIRTCNWDAKQLAKRVDAGTPIEVIP
ncbi:MAG: L,D-transpeptidase family protein [Candidatus Sumerlaeaceae bacterium]